MTDQTAPNPARRGRALAGVLTAVVVFALLVGVVLLVNRDGGDPAPTAASSAAPADPLTVEPQVTAGAGTLQKLAVTELIPGAGPEVKAGQTITVNYKLVSYRTGDLIDSSWKAGGAPSPFTTRIGTGELIKGWDQAIPGQKVGSRIQLDIPQDLAYGPQRGDLRFVVDILDAK